jgi:3-isopropylmalate/(R)-2-methylmalate dehydratase small subunit
MAEDGTIRGRTAAVRIDNLDTDQIMPKQFLRGIDKSGLAEGLLYDLRFDSAGVRKQDFVLNRPDYAGAKILLGGFNFGCGSSREHAVWGLLQYGIQAVIAPSFAEIFYSNAMGNRLLLVPLPTDVVEELMALSEQPDAPDISIDVESRTVRWGDHAPVPFPIADRHRRMFLEGVDVIGDSLRYRDDILSFAAAHWEQQPWLRDVAQRMKARVETARGA